MPRSPRRFTTGSARCASCLAWATCAAAPFPRSARFAETFAAAALDHGLVVWPNVGQADGVNGDLAMLAPPFVVSHDEIDLIVQRFGAALRATVERIGVVA